MSPLKRTFLIMDTGDIGKFPPGHTSLYLEWNKEGIVLNITWLTMYTWSPNKSAVTTTKLISKQRNDRLLTDEIKLPFSNRCCVDQCLVQCKVIRKPKFENLLLVESGMMGFGIQNSQFKQSGITRTIGNGIQVLPSRNRNPPRHSVGTKCWSYLQ